jgi:Fe-S cluster biogenesis protein NfuA
MSFTRDQVEEALNRIRPMLQVDGGNIELLDIVGNSVHVKMIGACSGCPASAMTLRHGVERILRQELSEFEELIAEF